MNKGKNKAKVFALLLLVGMFSLTYVTPIQAQGFPDYKSNTEWNPTDMEYLQLPTYCQAQFRPHQSRERQAVTLGCGPNFNHYCPGLVALNRASNPLGTKQQRRFVLDIAVKTLGGVLEKMTPTCPIAQEVRSAEQRARMLRMLVK